MRPDRHLPGPVVLASALSVFFAGTAFAQNRPQSSQPPSNDDNNDDNNDDDSGPPPLSTEDRGNNQASQTDSANAAEPTDDAEDDDAADDSSSAPNARTSSAPDSNDDEETSQGVSITNTGSLVTEITDTNIPTITGPADNGGGGGLTDAPTLTRNPAIPTYPAPTVPPTRNAPFMQHSTAPSGTVFIAVGAILGAFGLAILLWRLITGLLLHRSVERAARAQHDVNNKDGFPAPPAPFYKYTDQDSNMSLAGTGRGVRRTNRGPIPSSNPSQSNLFFSPTAANSNAPGNRASAFLPSGFYAANNNASQGHGHSISLTNLRPDSRGQPAPRNPMNPSPPESPGFPQQRRDLSTTSLNMQRPTSHRAPSAYLEDLLADDPSAFPPPVMPQQRGSATPPRHH